MALALITTSAQAFSKACIQQVLGLLGRPNTAAVSQGAPAQPTNPHRRNHKKEGTDLSSCQVKPAGTQHAWAHSLCAAAPCGC
jgi:hypothetical protein